MICTLDLGSTLASYHAANISYQSSTQSYQDQAAVFESQIALYQKNLDNTKALYEIGAASQTEIDQAELQLQSAVAQKMLRFRSWKPVFKVLNPMWNS